MKQLILFYYNYRLSYYEVDAVETINLAPIPAVPILETYAYTCCELGNLIKKLSVDLRFKEVNPFINPNP
jgi:hypothetical protein